MNGCRDIQPLLGMYALGRLTEREMTALQAHLDGCPLCRIEAAELRGVAEALVHADPERVEYRPEPPPWLRKSVFDRIDGARRRTRRRAAALGLAGLTAAAAAVTAFFLLGAPAAPDGPDTPTVAYSAGGVRASATLTPRPWGTALHLSVSGLTPGQNYTVWLERPDGRRTPAGSFTAQGSTRLVMDLSSGMKPHNATALGLSVSGGGPPILRAPIPRP
ncbi:anti-sigma factor [Thermomonospora echinospora]|nr:zf-HC2 domain-containing protein [Thermomonospora echinospora]